MQRYVSSNDGGGDGGKINKKFPHKKVIDNNSQKIQNWRMW